MNGATDRRSRVVLLMLGSRDARWVEPFQALQEKLMDEVGADRVTLAYMEMLKPSLHEVAVQASVDGIADLVILPMFLSMGGSVEQLIPQQVALLKEDCPQLGVILLPPVGEHPMVVDTIYEVARAACQC